MMVSRAALVGLLTLLTIARCSSSSLSGSKQREFVPEFAVMHNEPNEQTLHKSEASLEGALLRKAVPMEEYKSKMHAAGVAFDRVLEDRDEQDENQDVANGDDYYIDEDNMYSFSGWSLKYAKCQAIQRFSEQAVQNGEYSALVTDDVVILRLCPRKVCSTSSQYGCHYNFAEYAIGLSDYLRIMLKYTLDKRRNLCKFCQACDNQRQLQGDEDEEDDLDEEGEEEEDQNEEGEAEADGDDYYRMDDDKVTNGGGGGQTNSGGYSDCDTYQETCGEMGDWCDGENDDGVYLDIPDYLDYLDCVAVNGQGNYAGQAYWVRPYCDPSSEIIRMHLFTDPYCSQVTKEINLNDFSGMYFQSSMFEDYYSGICIDCSESNSPPYYNSGSYLCNKMHWSSAKCTTNMVYDLFDGQDENSATECSFIESIRFGTYDKTGAVSSQTSEYGETVQQEVSAFQKAGLVISIVACFALGIYACYLHHTITNLLIKSLSHSTLLPPVKRRSRNSSRASSRSSKRKTNPTYNSDWDDGAQGELT